MSKVADFRATVVKVFSSAVPPERRDLVIGESLEAAQIRNYLVPRKWQELDSVALENYDSRADLSALPAFLSGDGFRYYLPAFLLFIASHYEKAGLLVDSSIAALGRCQPDDFDESQRQLIISFLVSLEEQHPSDAPMCREIQRVKAILAGRPPD